MSEYDYREQDTRTKFILPKLDEAGWNDPPHFFTEERSFTDGRIVVLEGVAHRREPKVADYILRYRPDIPIAVVEAKRYSKHKAEGLQQAKKYAEMLSLSFAYATNGREIIEYDYLTGLETEYMHSPHLVSYGNA